MISLSVSVLCNDRECPTSFFWDLFVPKASKTLARSRVFLYTSYPFSSAGFIFPSSSSICGNEHPSVSFPPWQFGLARLFHEIVVVGDEVTSKQSLP